MEPHKKIPTKVTNSTENSFEKVAQTVAAPKNAKIFTTKLNLKIQNIYIKPLLKP
jgi:hypothetical protein